MFIFYSKTPKSGYICVQFMLLTVIISSVILLVSIIVMSSNTSITLIFMLILLHQIELEIEQKSRESILKHSIEAILPLIMY